MVDGIPPCDPLSDSYSITYFLTFVGSMLRLGNNIDYWYDLIVGTLYLYILHHILMLISYYIVSVIWFDKITFSKLGDRLGDILLYFLIKLVSIRVIECL